RDHPLVELHDDVGTLVRDVQVVLLSLPGPDALIEVGGRLSACRSVRQGSIVINTSTTGPAAAKKAAADLGAAGPRGGDAPVSGGATGARRGSLTIIVSGDPDAVSECGPVFDIIGEHVIHVGPQPGQAQAMKVANNVLSLGALAATAEATALTSKAGIPL